MNPVDIFEQAAKEWRDLFVMGALPTFWYKKYLQQDEASTSHVFIRLAHDALAYQQQQIADAQAACDYWQKKSEKNEPVRNAVEIQIAAAKREGQREVVEWLKMTGKPYCWVNATHIEEHFGITKEVTR